MANPAITIDRLEPLEMTLNLAPQIAFDRQLARGDRLDDVIDLFGQEIFCAEIRVDIRLFENLFRGARSDSVNIRQRRFDAFVAGDFHSKKSRHVN
jgi:hypothetical protein